MARFSRRTVAALLLCWGLVGFGVVAFVGARGGDESARVVARSADGEVTTIEYDGIRVDVPREWRRLDADGCEFGFESWGPAVDDPCDVEVGVAFYRSASFDSATGPRVLARYDDGATSLWAGYVLVGNWAVSVSDPERRDARRVLASVRASAE